MRLGPAANANKQGQGTAGDLKAPLAERTTIWEGEEIAYKHPEAIAGYETVLLDLGLGP